MIKVLAISGSPRHNGNTDLLLAKICEGAQSQSAASETLFLRELEINECDGCHACWKISRCKHRDSAAEIYRQIEESDLLIFGTPVYWYGPTGLMKTLIDRFVFFNSPDNRQKIKGKSAIVAIPFEEMAQETVQPVVDFFHLSLSYLEVELRGTIIAPGIGPKGEVLNHPEILDEAFKLGKKAVLDLTNTRIHE